MPAISTTTNGRCSRHWSPAVIRPGGDRFHPLRRIVDAIFYLLRTGAQWRMLPHEYPPRCAVFYHYAQWREDGTWEHVTQVLRESYRRTIGRSSAADSGDHRQPVGQDL